MISLGIHLEAPEPKLASVKESPSNTDTTDTKTFLLEDSEQLILSRHYSYSEDAGKTVLAHEFNPKEKSYSKVSIGSCILTYVTSCGGFFIRAERKLIPAVSSLSFKFKSISCGSDHVVALSSTGSLYSWGCNKYGQLGRESSSSSFSQGAGRVNLDQPALEIKCGRFHNLCLCEDGRVYSWGRGDYGQLGRDKDSAACSSVEAIKGFPADSRVTWISAGALHSAVVCDFELYTFGWGLYGQLGHGISANEHRPKKVSALEGVGRMMRGGQAFESVVQVDCGTWHTMVVSTLGDVYGCGWNTFGQIKPLPSNSSPTADLQQQQQQYFLPELVPLPDDKEAAKVSCASRHSAVSFQDGQVCILGSLPSTNSSNFNLEGNTCLDHRESPPASVFPIYAPAFVLHSCSDTNNNKPKQRVKCRDHVSEGWGTVILLGGDNV